MVMVKNWVETFSEIEIKDKQFVIFLVIIVIVKFINKQEEL